MLLGDLLAAIAPFIIQNHSVADVEITGAASDSRTVRPGFLFCAMKGARLDGHEYIGDAIKRGAAALLLEREVPLPASIPWVQIRDSYRALGLVAEKAAGKPADAFGLLAITGTNGKTTTAYLLRQIFRHASYMAGMIGTVEYDSGRGASMPADRTTPTPFELQQLFAQLKDNKAQYASIEVSSHALAQGRLGSTLCSAAIFTNLTQDHLDYHVTMENYYQAKKLLFTKHLRDGAPIVINGDDSYGARLAEELNYRNVMAFSFKNAVKANVHGRNLELSANGSVFDLSFEDGSSWRICTPLTGAYNAANVAGAAILAKAMGISQCDAVRALAACNGAPGRLQAIPVPGNAFAVFVDYAHTDDALRNVLTNLKQLPHHRITAVFGCGGDRDRRKRPLMAKAAAELADTVIVTSDNPRTEKPESIIEDILAGMPAGSRYCAILDRRAAIHKAVFEAEPGDIVLLAGKGHEDYQEINGVKHHFNDAEVAAECISENKNK